jgi:hypothetical protein
VQEKVFCVYVDFRIREEKDTMPQVQKHRLETADYIVSNRYFKEELRPLPSSSLREGDSPPLEGKGSAVK